MFTGLVEAMGRVASIRADDAGGISLTIRHEPWAGLLDIGESIALNGVCLTVVHEAAGLVGFEVGPETLARTTAGEWRERTPVNLERSLRLGDRLGGHIVQGHIDATATVRSIREQGGWKIFRFDAPDSILPLLVEKGSLAIDGISLTITDTDERGFGIMLIPHTLAVTTLGTKQEGDRVNLETDILARHVQRLLGAYAKSGAA